MGEQIRALTASMAPEQAGELGYDMLVEIMSALGDEDFMQLMSDINAAKLGGDGEQRRLVEETMAKIESLHKALAPAELSAPTDERRRACYGNVDWTWIWLGFGTCM